MENELLIVKPSNIHGNGVFAKIFIKAHTRLADYIGEEMSLKQYKEKYGNDMRMCYKGRNLFIIDSRNHPENICNYINESTVPNVVFKKRALYSLKDLQPDEELTLTYFKKYPRTYQL